MEIKTDSYCTILSQSSGIFKDRGSKFLAYAFPVSTDDEVKKHLEKLRKEYFDARHHCYAYRLGPDKLLFRANDDSEPSGTAGKPILGQIVSRNLTNVLVVVVRYFGGTLLGTSGLINAYREAAANALDNAKTEVRNVEAIYSLTFDYLKMNDVMKLVKDFEIEIIQQQFDMECRMTLRMNKACEPIVTGKMTNIDGLKWSFETYK